MILKDSFRTIGIMFLLSACGGSAAPLSGNFALSGTQWTGTYKAALNNGKFASPTHVRMFLHSDESFEIQSQSELFAMVTGTFTDMPKNKKLILDVKESNFELAGVEGTSYDFSYEHADDELVLSGQSGEYMLKSLSSDEVEREENPINGSWTCRKDPKSSTFFEINVSDNTFRGQLKEAGKSPVFIEGSASAFQLAKDRRGLLLTVITSNLASAKGNKLFISLAKDKNAILQQLTKQETEVKGTELPCTR